MLIEYIERLRKEPKEVRRQAVFLLTVVIVAGIVLLYIAFHMLTSVLPGSGSTQTIAAPYEAE